MRQRTLALLVLFLGVTAITSSQAAGPMGHYILARKIITNIASGGFKAPNELKQVLRDTDCQRAYCGGAIGPDLVEAKSHYGDTATLSMNMLNTARADMKRAAAKRDAKAFAAAKQELAFAYGWLSHFVIDMNVHQVVNGLPGIGDTYRYTSDAQKVMHGAYESQLTAYLRQTIWNPKDKYDVLIPYGFVASVVGVSDASVRQMSGVIKGKVALELVESGNCDLPREQLASMWNRVVTDSLQEVARCTNAPDEMKNWDMDVGHISTSHFDRMRSLVMEINDGKITPDWGKKYPEYWDAIKDLHVSEWRAKLMALMGKSETMPTKYRIMLTLNPIDRKNDMPGDWQEPYISTWLAIEIGSDGAFTFSQQDDDPPGLGHMKKLLSGSGTLSKKGELTWQGTITGGQTYVSQYGNGPDIRFVQTDKAKFNESGTVTVQRYSDGQVKSVTFAQTSFESSFDSTMTRTELDDKGNDKSTKSSACSGTFVAKHSGIESIEAKK